MLISLFRKSGICALLDLSFLCKTGFDNTMRGVNKPFSTRFHYTEKLKNVKAYSITDLPYDHSTFKNENGL